jgi:hypothetical protein
MSDPEMPAQATAASACRTGVYLAILQLALTLTWAVYVVYLPKLLADVGLRRRP